MGTIQIADQKINGKIYRRYSMNIDKAIIEKLMLKKGDRLLFNGEYGGEVKFTIQRQ